MNCAYRAPHESSRASGTPGGVRHLDRNRQTGSAHAIASASGFDDDTTQQVLSALDSKGYFADALRDDGRIDAIAFS